MGRENLLAIAAQSGALFLAIWAIFRLVPSVPASWKAWVWRLAFLKPLICLLPFAVVTLRVIPAEPIYQQTAPVSNETVDATLVATVANVPAVPVTASTTDPLLVAWLIGAAFVAAIGLRGAYRAIRVVRNARPVEDSVALEILDGLLKRAGIRVRVRLLHSEDASGAMLVAKDGAAIVIPTSILDASRADLRMTLAHEVAHLARRDLPWFGVIWLVQSLFFFNPAVWLATRSARLDHESATDRHASRLAGVSVQTYAAMLLRATVVARPSVVPGSLPMAESYRTIHRRLEAMKYFNSPLSPWRKASIALLAATTCAFLPSYQLAQAAPETVVLDTPTQDTTTTPTLPRPAKPGERMKSGKVKILLDKAIQKNPQLLKRIKEQKGKGTEWVVLEQGGVAYFYKYQGGALKFQRSAKVDQLKTVPAKKKPSTTQGHGQIHRTNPLSTTLVSVDAVNAHRIGTQVHADPFVDHAISTTSVDAVVAQTQAHPATTHGTTHGMTHSTAHSTADPVSHAEIHTTIGTVSTVSTAADPAMQVGTGVVHSTDPMGQTTIGTVATSGQQTGTGRVTNRIVASPSKPKRTITFSSSSESGSPMTISFQIREYDVQKSIAMLFQHAGLKYKTVGSLKGTVSASVTNVSFDTALAILLRAADAKFKVENGTYVITARSAE